jgi:hypothetical protein
MQDDPPQEDDDLPEMLDGLPITAPHIPKNKPWKLLKRYGSILIAVEICLLIF